MGCGGSSQSKLSKGRTVSATLEGHRESVRSVCFSPDGTRLASASEDKMVRLWDTVTGKCLRVLKGHTMPVWSVCFSPDGTRLASASVDDTVRLWNTATGEPVSVPLKGHKGIVTSVCFSLDGSRLASASSDKTVRLWTLSEAQRGHPAPPPAPGAEVVVKTLSGASARLPVALRQTVRALKQQVAEVAALGSLRAEQQRLLRGDTVLDRDVATLAACGVRDGDTLHLVRQVAGTEEVGRDVFAAAILNQQQFQLRRDEYTYRTLMPCFW